MLTARGPEFDIATQKRRNTDPKIFWHCNCNQIMMYDEAIGMAGNGAEFSVFLPQI
jgi:hypothetical protein